MSELTDLLQFLAILCAPIATMAIVIPVGRALARQLHDRAAGSAAVSDDRLAEMTARLQRLETSIDAIAIEIERNGELQRYAARLLELRGSIALPEATTKPAIGTITPH
jgi:hypothetical protein